MAYIHVNPEDLIEKCFTGLLQIKKQQRIDIIESHQDYAMDYKNDDYMYFTYDLIEYEKNNPIDNFYNFQSHVYHHFDCLIDFYTEIPYLLEDAMNYHYQKFILPISKELETKANKIKFKQVLSEIENEVAYRPGNVGYERCIENLYNSKLIYYTNK